MMARKPPTASSTGATTLRSVVLEHLDDERT
jgi:hypothetical protein